MPIWQIYNFGYISPQPKRPPNAPNALPMPILAALATIPGRGEALGACLRSLRPQVDELRVICHDMEEAPEVVRELADSWICEPDVRGSAAKLHWTSTWAGLYLGCDDDFEYPADYANTMLRWVRRWRGKALVVGHGRVLTARSTGFLDVSAAAAPRTKTMGTWLNYPGACALAFDTRLNVPDRVPGKNLEEVHLAVWAQENSVPIWLVPHAANWLDYRLEEGLPTIWAEEKGAGFQNRNVVIAARSAIQEWTVHRA